MRRRHGFTIPELLVAMALIIFIMMILAEAFRAGLDSLRELKAIGDMQDQLRAARTIICEDLRREHFGDAVDGVGGPRLRDQRLDLATWHPPEQGFFRIWQVSPPPSTQETTLPDGDGLHSFRANNHFLHFTVRLRGNRPEDFLACQINPANPPSPLETLVQPPDFRQSNVYRSQWAEVVYFLRPNGQSAGTTPLFSLHRRQLLAVPTATPDASRTITEADYDYNYPEMSYPPTQKPPLGNPPPAILINTPEDLTIPHKRFGAKLPATAEGEVTNLASPYQTLRELFQQLQNTAPNDPRIRSGDDLLLTDVISFEVKIAGTATGLNWPNTASNDYPFDDIPLVTQNSALSNKRVFDTWTQAPVSPSNTFPYDQEWRFVAGQPRATTLPNPIRVKKIQIRIRIWNQKTERTRQITIIQDM